MTGITTRIVEIAGYANQNTFGIYDSSGPAHLLQVYSGANDPFDNKLAALNPPNEKGRRAVNPDLLTVI